MSFPRPTVDELKKIKQVMLDPDSVDESKIGVVRQLMANNDITSYNTVLSLPILHNFVRDITKPDGTTRVPLMLNHPSLSEALPLGTSFDAELREVEGKTTKLGEPLVEVFGKFYTVDGKETIAMGSSGFFSDKTIIEVDTESIGTKYSAGLIRSGSVGFHTTDAVCNICNRPYGHEDCDHVWGKKYDGKICVARVGVTSNDSNKSDGYLREYSLVVAGAVKDAGAVQSYNNGSGETTQKLNFMNECSCDPVRRNDERLNDNSCANNNMRTEGSNKPTQKEQKMGIELSAEKYEELVEYKLKLADSEKKADESSTLVTELRAELASLADSQATIDSLTAEKEKFDGEHKFFMEAVTASGIKAYGAGKDENAEKYAEMSFEELTTVYESNIAVYCDNLTKGDTSQDDPENGTEEPKKQYFEANKVASTMIR